MQFIRKGPEIPERLLQLHEDGRVVFFCGAGISYPAQLPGFGSLVKQLYETLSISPNAVQQAALKTNQFDTAIALLETDVKGGRETVRRTVAEILTKDLTNPNATATHEALLTLGQNREGQLRLITTNFDRIFEHVITSKSLLFSTYQAPLLPVPKTRWDGLIYLHGLLSKDPTQGDLDRLVISSGDFGLAYLIERWASRFVSELFRNYTVCFVGYSINDPVLRYMMDALAADKLLGESPPEMFAFGSCVKGKEAQAENDWKAKNVTPILYNGNRHHTNLHKTLHAWANVYRDGVRGKERIVAECAGSLPLASTIQDNFVGRMLWALSHNSGLPAKLFANFNPAPSLDWLEALSQNLYNYTDLGRFGIPPSKDIDKELAFSLIQRPAPYTKSPWMSLVNYGSHITQWDDVMRHLAAWLTRYINDPKLLLWFIKQGGQFHYELVNSIEGRIKEISSLEQRGAIDELNKIQKDSPNGIPSKAMRKLWRLLLNNQVETRSGKTDIYRWREHFKQEGLTVSARLALREALRPVISLREAFQWPRSPNEIENKDRIEKIVDWEIKLVSRHVHSALRDVRNNEQWVAALPNMLNDFNTLLHDAFDLMNELGGANSRSDYSYIHRPSISEHTQNKRYHDWTVLIELVRDAWLAMAEKSPDQARIFAETWMQAPYPVFKRLAFFAAAQPNIVSQKTALGFLLQDNHWWLWATETQRETMRLLLALSPQLEETELKELEQVILAGPPREMFSKDIDAEELDKHIHWLKRSRLVKILQAKVPLSAETNQALVLYELSNSDEQLEANDKDEFPVWMDSGWTGDRDPWKKFSSVPRTRKGALSYLILHPALNANEQDDWKELCVDSFYATAYALCKLTKKNNNWPVERWRDALQSWSEEKQRVRSWHYIAPLLVEAPEELLQHLTHEVSWWLQSIAKTANNHSIQFFKLAYRILELNFDPLDDLDNTNDPIFRAINHPIGHVTQALLDWWYRKELEDDQLLPDDLKTVFSMICNTQVAKFKFGRLLLASHAITLFRVDKDWTTQYLLPLFNWTSPNTETHTIWAGYLWSRRLHRPMIELIKPAFLEIASHYSELGKSSEQYTSLLTLAALEPGDTFTTSELATTFRALPSEALGISIRTITNTLESAGDQSENYWKNRVEPFLKKIWPKTNDKVLDKDDDSIALLCIASGNDFPSAIDLTRDWLQSTDTPDYVIHRLHESGLYLHFPKEALSLLNATIPTNPHWLPQELRECLTSIAQNLQSAHETSSFIRLDELARQHGY